MRKKSSVLLTFFLDSHMEKPITQIQSSKKFCIFNLSSWSSIKSSG